MIEVIPFRTRAGSMPVPKLDGGWYHLATDQIIDFEASIDTNRCYINMRGAAAPIRILVKSYMEWLDEWYAEATFCRVLFRDNTDESLLT